MIIGEISNIVENDVNITFNAINIHTISFSPFTFIPCISNERVTVSKEYIGILKEGRIFGIFLFISASDQDGHFPIYCESDIVDIYWYSVGKTWDNNGMLINLTVKVLHQSIVNRTISFNETFEL